MALLLTVWLLDQECHRMMKIANKLTPTIAGDPAMAAFRSMKVVVSIKSMHERTKANAKGLNQEVGPGKDVHQLVTAGDHGSGRPFRLAGVDRW